MARLYTRIYDHFNDNWEAGYQECGLTGKTGATNSGLSATTQYYYKININGAGVVEYDITTGASATFDEIIALMNVENIGATWEIVGGDYRCRTITTGSPSTIALAAGTTGTDLFATLTGFVSFDAAVAGIIAKPTFFDMTEQSFVPEPSFGILTNLPIPDFGSVVSDSQEYGRGWPFTLYLNALTDANLELMIEQTVERINDYVSGNQRWYITSFPTFNRGSGIKHTTINCIEASVIEETAF